MGHACLITYLQLIYMWYSGWPNFHAEGQVRFYLMRINVVTNRSYLGWQLMDQQSDLQLPFNVNNWSNEQFVCSLYWKTKLWLS